MAFNSAKDVSQLGRILAAENFLSIVVFVTPIRRIEIKQHTRPIVAFDELPPRQVLDHNAGHAFVNVFELRREVDPDSLPDALPRGSEIPDNLDPLAAGALMQHQIDWIADDSTLKVCEKGRRTGITFAEALDCTLIAAAKRSAGGQNIFYIPDSKPKGREFIRHCAHFARNVSEMLTIEDGIYFDMREDGTTKAISSYIMRFASGFRIEALSSGPENIRGLQGTVVIDEAAFHRNVNEVIDAVGALLMRRSTSVTSGGPDQRHPYPLLSRRHASDGFQAI